MNANKNKIAAKKCILKGMEEVEHKVLTKIDEEDVAIVIEK